MNSINQANQLSTLFINHFAEKPTSIIALPSSGSDRKYFRITSKNYQAIGAFNNDLLENEAFFSFTKTFHQLKLNVPEIYTIEDDRKHYLLTDLGDETLFSRINEYHQSGGDESPLCCIKNAISNLVHFQFEGAKHIDFTACYPRKNFDSQSIQWDLNYFKYNFLKLAKVTFNEEALETDFQHLTTFLLEAPSGFFMFRDFQSRNIMIIENKTWFIDYQGGRKGPLQYDLASILYSPKTQLNEIQRESLLHYYLKKLSEKTATDQASFIKYYYGFVLIRILQAMGAYGYRGIFEGKANFKQSIPAAIQNLKFIFDQSKLQLKLPEIERILQKLSDSEWANSYQLEKNRLTIRITSFSYKKGIPNDPSENGGGFAFDCRGLPNPGRLKPYKKLSGLNEPVKAYLMGFSEVHQFQEHAQKMVKISIDEYLKRGFNHLCINFGCTGGQHRSVYNAELMNQWISNNYEVKTVVIHTEKENW